MQRKKKSIIDELKEEIFHYRIDNIVFEENIELSWQPSLNNDRNNSFWDFMKEPKETEQEKRNN